MLGTCGIVDSGFDNVLDITLHCFQPSRLGRHYLVLLRLWPCSGRGCLDSLCVSPEHRQLYVFGSLHFHRRDFGSWVFYEALLRAQANEFVEERALEHWLLALSFNFIRGRDDARLVTSALHWGQCGLWWFLHYTSRTGVVW